LAAFKTLKHLACPVVPELLGYQEGTQEDNEIVPSGYEISIVWENVPGKPPSQDYFGVSMNSSTVVSAKNFARSTSKFMS
jgi:hypothetical protein